MKKKKPIHEVLFAAELKVRQGKIEPAIGMLNRLRSDAVPFELLAKFGGLCRRTGLYHKGLLALTPAVYGKHGKAIPAALKAEFANLLQRRGIVQEAEKILESISELELPEALLYRGFCHVTKWEYRKSIELFKRYLPIASNNYLGLIGEVNLVAAEIAIGLPRAEESLSRVMEKALRLENNRLIANCLDLKAQIEIDQGRHGEAQATLKKAAEALPSDQPVDSLAIKKWMAVNEALRQNSVEPIDHFLRQSHVAVEFELRRSLDFYKLKIQFDQERFDYLYFGTPHPDYRERIVSLLNRSPSSESYVWGDKNSPTQHNLCSLADIEKLGVKLGSELHEIILVLMSDFYQPFRAGRLFSELFQEEILHEDILQQEKFNPSQSPAKVRMLVSRFNERMKEKDTGLVVIQTPQGYQLGTNRPLGLRTAQERKLQKVNGLRAQALDKAMREKSQWTSRELKELLFAAEAELPKLLQNLVVEKKLRRVGHGRAARYLSFP